MLRKKIVLQVLIGWMSFSYCHKTTVKLNRGKSSERSHCTFLQPDTLLCLQEIKDILSYSNFTREMIICDWPNEEFDPQQLSPLHNLENITMFNNNFTEFIDDFPSLKKLKYISISDSKLSYVQSTLFRKLPKLKTVDLRKNEIKKLESEFILLSNFTNFYLANNPFNCTSNMKWMLRHTHSNVLDKNKLICSDAKYHDRPVLTVMYFKHEMKTTCLNDPVLRKCICHISYLRLDDDGKSFRPMISVDCSYQRLTHLPPFLPENTTVLYVTHNRISDLTILTTNEHYQMVTDVYLDHNRIVSINILEDSEWLDNFRVLSLKGNNLRKIPVYFLQHVLEKNHGVGKIYLGQNPWSCDCLFITRYQEFLRKYQAIVIDSKNITCKSLENGEMRVLSLDRSDVCSREPDGFFDNIYNIISCVLATLIILLMVNLSYDYYRYKKYGKLPWIVTKLF